MKALNILFLVVAVFAVVSLSSGYAMAAAVGQMMPGCEKNFRAMDTLDQGFITYNDYLTRAYGPGGHKGLAPSGNAPNNFYSMDSDSDGRVNVQEYCSWTAPSTMPMR